MYRFQLPKKSKQFNERFVNKIYFCDAEFLAVTTLNKLTFTATVQKHHQQI